MKTTFIILFMALIFPATSFSQINWISQNSGINSELEAVYFVDENNGWISGNIGIILHTTDGGLTWNSQDTPANWILYSIFFTDIQNGWAAGYGGEVIHTTDGGENWFSQDNLGYQDIYKLYFIDSNNGWAAGGSYDFQTGIYERVIYNTTNGGNNWGLQYGMVYESQLHSIYFTDATTGYAAGESGIIMKTTDGGNNWVEIQNISGFNFADISFTNSSTGFVVGEYLGVPHYSVIFKTTDSGNNWTEIQLGTDEILASIQFTNFQSGWAVGNDYDYNGNNLALIYHTSDGGDNWVKQNNLPFEALANVFFINSTKGWAVGHLGTILTTDNPTPVELTSFTAKPDKDNLLLEWQTSTEINNKGFEIQRSDISSNYSNWNVIGFVEGSGSTTKESNYSYLDKNLKQGKYVYKLIQIDFDGTRAQLHRVNVAINYQPVKYELDQNYPNPFNPATLINYQIPENGFVTLKVFNTVGKEVATLVNERQTNGSYSINFNASNLPSGLYIYQLRINNFVSSKKMLLIK
jgi:photosystem II stability/assembly factor-like uncharacterized protein